jgi:hypothetical protein
MLAATPFLERGAAGRDGGAHRPARALGHGLAPGKTDLPHHLRGHPVGDGVDVGGRVGQGQLAIRRAGPAWSRTWGTCAANLVAQQLVLGHRKPVPGGSGSTNWSA